MEIEFLNRYTGRIEQEQVYGEASVNFIYGSSLGKLLWPLISSPLISQLYGSFQASKLSQAKIAPFVEEFNIALDDFELDDPVSLYETFNDFFYYFI